MSNQAAAISVGSEQLISLEVGGFRVTDANFPAHLHLASHYHPRACLAVLLDGAVEKTYRQSAFETAPTSVLTMPPEERHTDQFLAGGAHILVIEPGSTTTDVLQPYARIFECHHFPHPEITRLASRLARELRVSDTATPLAVTGLAFEMIALTARAILHTPTSRPAPRWLVRVEDTLRSCIGETWSLETLADESGVHPVHLARAFRLHYGLSIGEYVRRLRLDWAAHRLRMSDDPLASVAMAAGFTDQSHFTRLFKQHTGQTPGQYRQTTKA